MLLFTLSARDVMGYTMIVFLTLVPAGWRWSRALGLTLRYPLLCSGIAADLAVVRSTLE